MSKDDRKDVIEVVSDASGKSSDSLHALCAHELLFQFAAFGDIAGIQHDSLYRGMPQQVRCGGFERANSTASLMNVDLGFGRECGCTRRGFCLHGHQQLVEIGAAIVSNQTQDVLADHVPVSTDFALERWAGITNCSIRLEYDDEIRDVLDERAELCFAALQGFVEIAEASGHIVENPCQTADLIAAANIDPLMKLSTSERADGSIHLFQSPGDGAGNAPTEEYGNQEDGKGDRRERDQRTISGTPDFFQFLSFLFGDEFVDATHQGLRQGREHRVAALGAQFDNTPVVEPDQFHQIVHLR